jgi:hypothetical protein
MSSFTVATHICLLFDKLSKINLIDTKSTLRFFVCVKLQSKNIFAYHLIVKISIVKIQDELNFFY